MAQNKEKTYTPQEAAAAVLKKVEELYKNSILAKTNTSHEIENGSEPNNDEAEAPEQLQVGDVTRPGQGEKKKKKKGSDSSAEGESEDSEGESEASDGEQPEHEEDMSAEEDKEHDAKENQDDEKDADKIEADEEPEAKAADKKAEKKEDKSEDKGKKDDKKKMPFQKSESSLQKFMDYRLKKKALNNRKEKTKKMEKFLGLGGSQTSRQAGVMGQKKPTASTAGETMADKINFGGNKK
jgi:hypothetical protein